MEEDIDLIFENKTELENVKQLYLVHDTFNITSCLIGIVADILIIYMIAGNKRMRTSTNIIILNWAITDICVLMMAMFYVRSVLQMLDAIPMNRSSYCMFVQVDSTFQVMSTIFIFSLLSNDTFEANMTMNRIALKVFYLVMLLIGTGSIVSCCYNYNLLAIPLVTVLLFLCLVATVIGKEVYLCCKCKTIALNGEFALRFNVVRIYTYNWLMCCFLFLLINLEVMPKSVTILLQLASFSGYLCSVYLLVYLTCADQKFKICLVNIFRKESDRYDVDASIGFTNESSEEVEEYSAFEDVNIHGDSDEINTR